MYHLKHLKNAQALVSTSLKKNVPKKKLRVCLFWIILKINLPLKKCS